MKKADLSQTSTADLQEKLKEERNTLDKMFFTHAISPVENPMRIPLTKKSIARMLTELRKRELSETKK
jgi:large subunit ribosomal protein L29